MKETRDYTPLSVLTTTFTSTTAASIALPSVSTAFYLNVESFDAIVTFDGSTPVLGTTSTSSTGHVWVHAQTPQLVLVGNGATIKFIGAAAGTGKACVTPLE